MADNYEESKDLRNLIEKFNNISLEETDYQDAILNLKIMITNNNNLRNTASSLEIEPFLNLIRHYYLNNRNTSKKRIDETLSNASVVLDRILSFRKVEEIFTLFRSDTFDQTVSQVADEDFQSTCLKQIYRSVAGNSSPWILERRFVEYLLNSVRSSSLGIASIATKTLCQALSTNENIEWFFSSSNGIRILKETLSEGNPTIRCRIYELIVKVIIIHPSCLENIITLELLDGLFKELYGDDILLQLNCLEILSQLAVIQEGFHMIKSKGLLDMISQIILSEDPINSFLIPGTIKFFGNLAKSNLTECILKYPRVIEKFYDNLFFGEPVISILSAETIAHIASTSQGLKLLYEKPDSLKNAIKHMGRLVSEFNKGDHERRRILDSLVGMFDHDSTDVEASMVCEKLYAYLNENTMLFLFNLIKQPFTDIRFGGLQLLRVISKFNWVEQDMALCAGLMEYLLDRKTESEKEGLELKYDIIKTLSTSSTSKENLGYASYEAICKYEKQGPFYSESELIVDVGMNE